MFFRTKSRATEGLLLFREIGIIQVQQHRQLVVTDFLNGVSVSVLNIFITSSIVTIKPLHFSSSKRRLALISCRAVIKFSVQRKEKP